MPAAYDTSPNRFDEVIAEACPHRREEIGQRIDTLRAEWTFQEMVKLKRGPAIVRDTVSRG